MLQLQQEMGRPYVADAPCEGEGQAAHAVVIGASIAGLTAARALAGHFARVTIVERDYLPADGKFRDGVPQARHVHTLQPRGRRLLEQQFPGLTDELLAQGALLIDPRREMAVFEHGAWQEPPGSGARPLLAASRPLLEAALRRRLAVLPRVRLLSGYQVVGLLADGQKRRDWGWPGTDVEDNVESELEQYPEVQ
ncbi:MAG TPA: hypothetical protein VK879_23210 [Candidatus Sulfomarinibacteraceae bacterium]|nr:hypothetical protein [Candidatus Sulfomarinibacteraceae bacterium]